MLTDNIRVMSTLELCPLQSYIHYKQFYYILPFQCDPDGSDPCRDDCITPAEAICIEGFGGRTRCVCQVGDYLKNVVSYRNKELL